MCLPHPVLEQSPFKRNLREILRWVPSNPEPSSAKIAQVKLGSSKHTTRPIAILLLYYPEKKKKKNTLQAERGLT
jgi:hypothetical protein